MGSLKVRQSIKKKTINTRSFPKLAKPSQPFGACSPTALPSIAFARECACDAHGRVAPRRSAEGTVDESGAGQGTRGAGIGRHLRRTFQPSHHLWRKGQVDQARFSARFSARFLQGRCDPLTTAASANGRLPLTKPRRRRRRQSASNAKHLTVAKDFVWLNLNFCIPLYFTVETCCIFWSVMQSSPPLFFFSPLNGCIRYCPQL